MAHVFRFFWFPILLWILALGAVFVWGGIEPLIIACILTVLEVTLSFDNAVVNARVLERMSPVWQKRFITWGIPVAVFGTRFILPILIVSAAAQLAPLAVAHLALFDPHTYGEHLHDVHDLISSFGGMFLLMVGLKYFFDSAKEDHWIAVIERWFAKFGRIEAVEIGIAMAILLFVAWFAPHDPERILFAGMIGILLFIFMQGISRLFEGAVGATTAASGLALFMYLELLDAAFSLDGVIGAFAITSALPVIVAGLGVGAFFVRSLTVYMVKEKTLDTLRYLEHGAHYAIVGLAVAMLASIFTEIPEVVTGCIGIVFVVAAYWSSVRVQKKA